MAKALLRSLRLVACTLLKAPYGVSALQLSAAPQPQAYECRGRSRPPSGDLGRQTNQPRNQILSADEKPSIEARQRPASPGLWGTARRECLDHLLVFGRRHLERVLSEFLEHYHQARPHQGLGQRPPCRLADVTPTAEGRVERRDRLGGLPHEYSRAA
jgi:transposase InsO family protein